MQQPIPIFKGDSTDAFSVRTIRIKLTTEVSLTDATAKFELLSFSKTFTNAEVLTKVFTITIPSTKTSLFPFGKVFGKLTLFDSQSRTMTASCTIPFIVVLPGRNVNGFYKTDTSVAEITVEMGYDYNLAYNKPSINGVVIEGAQGGKDYGLNKILEYSASSAYAVGNQVVYDTDFYECTVAITEGEEWNASHWKQLGNKQNAMAVHYTADADKTEAQKAQARTNIGAASSADLTAEVTRATAAESALASRVSAVESGKQDALSSAQMAAVNSGIDETKVAQIATNASNIANVSARVTTIEGKESAWDAKQDAIPDLATIRSNAAAGKTASETIAGYGDVVTHDADEFASAAQGAKADSALQPSDVVNNVTSTDADKPLSAKMGKDLNDAVTQKLDAPSAAGTTGQVLTKTASGVAWQDPQGGGEGTVKSVTVNSGAKINPDAEGNIALTDIASAAALDQKLTAPTEAGSVGQVLTKTASGTAWQNAADQTKIVSGAYEVHADGTVYRPTTETRTVTQFTLSSDITFNPASPTFNPHYDSEYDRWFLADAGEFEVTFLNGSESLTADGGKIYTTTPITASGNYSFIIDRDPASAGTVTVGTAAITVVSSSAQLVGTVALTNEVQMSLAWVAGTSYSVGNVVLKDGKLYQCVTANSDASWTAAHWSQNASGQTVADDTTHAKTASAGGKSASVDTSTGDLPLDNLFDSGNTALATAVTAILPAVALKETSDEGEYEIDAGAANPWDYKVGAITAGGQSATVSGGVANANALFGESNTVLAETIDSAVESTLAEKSGTAISLNSGEIGNLTLAASATATINLVCPSASTKAGDAVLRVTAGAGATIGTITVNGSACTVEKLASDALTLDAGVNYLFLTRTAIVSGTAVVLVSRQTVES